MSLKASFPLERVAADQRPLIAAFREAGSKSFQDADSMATARANYEASCAANGLTPDPIAHVSDVAIGAGDEQFRVRVYDPREQDAAESTPVLVFAHGGGWVIGSLDTHDQVCRRFATRTGLPVVAIDYRLGPEHPFPAAHEDSARAVAWVRDEAAARGWDASRIVTLGDSAGGGIATALAAVESMRVPGTEVVAQVLLYPVLDLAHESPGYARIEQGAPLTADSMRWFAENFLANEQDAHDDRVSPIQVAIPGAAPQPPAWILGLGLDPLGDEAVEYARQLALNGTHVELVYLPNHAHGLFTSAGKIRTGEELIDRASEFVLRILAGQ